MYMRKTAAPWLLLSSLHKALAHFYRKN